MTDQAEAGAQRLQQLAGEGKSDAANPANERLTKVTEETRIPMSVPNQKLEAPDIEGYHLHWFVGENVPRAIQAGYEYVDKEEITINNFNLADNLAQSGSTDMGTRISVVAGRGIETAGQAERLYLMKIRQAWWEKDQQEIEAKNDRIAAALRGDGELPGEQLKESERHVPKWAPQRKKGANNLFTPK